MSRTTKDFTIINIPFTYNIPNSPYIPNSPNLPNSPNSPNSPNTPNFTSQLYNMSYETHITIPINYNENDENDENNNNYKNIIKLTKFNYLKNLFSRSTSTLTSQNECMNV